MDNMEDGGGIAIPSQSDIPEDENSQMDESQDSELSKQTSGREQIFLNTEKNYTDSNSFRNFVGFSNVNGDCAEKKIDISGRILRSSSTNSLSSVVSAYSETTRDSTHDDSSVHKEVDSGSEDDSKSSCSEASVKENTFNLPKSEDSHHISSDLSDSSSDSESSESDDSCVDKDNRDFGPNKVDDNARLNVSPDRSNVSGDSEKEFSSEEDDYEESGLKSNDETMNSENLNIECTETKDSSVSLPVDTNISKSENTSIDQNQQKIEVSDLNISDKIAGVENLYSGSIDNHAKSPESPEQDEPSFENMENSSKASSDYLMDVENKTVESSSEYEPRKSLVNEEIKNINQEPLHLDPNEVAERVFNKSDNIVDVKVDEENNSADEKAEKQIDRGVDQNDLVDKKAIEKNDLFYNKVDEKNDGVDNKVGNQNYVADTKAGEKNYVAQNIDEQHVGVSEKVDKQNDGVTENIDEQNNSSIVKVDEHNNGTNQKVDEPKNETNEKIDDKNDETNEKVDEQSNLVDKLDDQINPVEKVDEQSNLVEKIDEQSNLVKKVDEQSNLVDKLDGQSNPVEKVDEQSNLAEKVDEQSEGGNEKVDEQNDKDSNQSDNDPVVNKNKTEERLNINDLGVQFSIQYTGFKKTRNITGISSDDKYVFKNYNPFNPAWKRNSKSRLSLLRNCRDEIDCSTLQPEYAQYLGLQPIVKFKCSNCGMSTFQTMSALNTHQVECKKNGKHIAHNSEINQSPDVNSANIKLTRKVFLCSTCGTYYENCDLFLHMREFHRRYICLFCLFMAQSPDVLQEHLKDKHSIVSQTYTSVEELQKNSPQTFFLLCLRCDRVFTEMDDSANHKCTNKNSLDLEHGSFKRPRTDNIHLQDYSNDSNLATSDSCKSKTSPKMIKEGNANKFNTLPRVCNEKYYTEDENKETLNANFSESPMDVDSEMTNNKIERQDAVLEAENLQLKVPSGIEIKPLVPGEHIIPDKDEPNRSAIEIFPINAEPVKKKAKLVKKSRKIIKKTIKRKPINVIKIKKISENMLQATNEGSESNELEVQPQMMSQEDTMQEYPSEYHNIEETEQVTPPPATYVCNDLPEMKHSHSQEVFKIKLPTEYYSEESDDSQKLSMVVDENTNNSDTELKKTEDPPENGPPKEENSQPESNYKLESNEISLAREDVAAMALTLDDKIENVPIQAVVKECVRTSCLSCNYCRHACKIAVNGKQLALHLLSEHRYTPVKNETHDDVVRKLSSSMEVLQNMHFNTETYDSSDLSIHIPYDQEKNFDCFQCSYVSSSHKDLYAHKRKSHTKSLLLCIMCKSNFYSYSELICHICPGSYNAKVQFHNIDLIFRCCFCRLDTIPSAFRLMVHLRKSHHTCDICLEMCIDQQKLSTHMWKHKLNHLCYRCGIAYASKPDITKHLFWKHGTESVLCKKCLQKKWPHVYHFCIPPTSFICEECNISFSKAVALKVHKRIHCDDYPYPCDQCEKKFVSKKLLNRHIERHIAIAQRKEKQLNSPQEEKEEIINVTDLSDGKECLQNENSDVNKESDGKDRGHKKHKKEKEKKEKKVVDVYDLPPLNLSSESDSSDEEESAKVSPSKEIKEVTSSGAVSSDVKLSPLLDDQHHLDEPDMPKLDVSDEGNSLPIINDQLCSSVTDDAPKQELEPLNNIDVGETSVIPSTSEPISVFNKTTDNTVLPLSKDQVKIDDQNEPAQNDEVEGIWENFYKTNPQNSNLPFPLCAMKSELAYKLIMGDHDYCLPPKTDDPIIKEDIPTVSNLVASFSDDKLEEITPIIPEKPPQTPPQKEQETFSTPTSVSKKKLKSPKKKISKTPDENNSSSSSDSSSDSDTTSCSCGTNCSCSSSSSNSSSSSSSDSDSSTNDDKIKQDKRKKRKDKRVKPKSESEIDVVKETVTKEPEVDLPVMPEDPPIQESELETDEITSDEEFYDRQPQIIANQMLAEKRQLVLLASGSPAVNNGNASPTVPPPPQEPAVVPPPTEPMESPKQRIKPKRKRKVGLTPKLSKIEKTPIPDSYSKFLNTPKPYSPFQHGITTPKQKPHMPIPQSPSLPEAGGSGPESDNTRLSKRRRVPNRFYGYSSGEEEEAGLGGVKQTPKWRKFESQMTPVHTPKIQPSLPPPTPRIQLTVPKQVIRKPTYHKASMKAKQQQTWSESSDSGGSDVDDRLPRPGPQEPIKTEKDVYCYCRCPYDEVSEMIACDDSNCKIEWFHFECVGILVPPRGQWFCPGCRKARGLPT